MVCGLATSVGLEAGFGSPVFIVALSFALITMFDASTVRQAAGQQARILNEMLNQFFQEGRLSDAKVKELLGHTPLEVLTGMLLGITIGLLLFFATRPIGPAT